VRVDRIVVAREIELICVIAVVLEDARVLVVRIDYDRVGVVGDYDCDGVGDCDGDGETFLILFFDRRPDVLASASREGRRFYRRRGFSAPLISRTSRHQTERSRISLCRRKGKRARTQ
jgi:hypothetical protein